MSRFPWLTPVIMALRNLRLRPWRTLLTLLGITLGVAVVLATDITNRNTLSSLEGMFARAVGDADLQVIPVGEEQTLDGVLLDKVERMPGVLAAAPTVSLLTELPGDTTNNQAYWSASGVQVGRKLEVRGILPEVDPEVRVYVFEAGRMPEPGAWEAAIPQRWAAEKELELGDDLPIMTPEGVDSLVITGLLANEGAGMINDGVVAFVPLEVVQELFGLGNELAEISLQVEDKIANDPSALARLKGELEKRVGRAALVTYPAARGELVPRMLSSYQLGLSFFSIIAFFMGAFLIYNTFSMTVVERTREIGMLRAIGMRRRQVMSLVLTEAGLLALAGSALGVLGGMFLARGLTILMGGFLPVDERLTSLSLAGLLKSISLGLLVTFLATLLPARGASHISPLQALMARGRTETTVRPQVWAAGLVLLSLGWGVIYIRPDWPADFLTPLKLAAFLVFLMGAVLTVPLAIDVLKGFTRWAAIWLYRNEGSLGASNLRRSVIRTTVTVASLMIALIMIIGVNSLSHTIKKDVQDWVNNALGGDVLISGQEPLREDFARQLGTLTGVEVVSPTRILEVQVAPASLSPGKEHKETLYLFAVDPDRYRRIGDKVFAPGQDDPDAAWERLAGGSALFVSSVTAEEYGLKKGSTLTLKTRRGEKAFTVVAITTEFTRQGFVITCTYDDLKRWFGESGADQLTIKVTPGTDIQALSQEILDRYEERFGIRVQTTGTYKESVMVLYNQAIRLFNVLSMIGVVIGAMGVLNTMTMNVLERTREIGVLRSVGMLRRQVVRMVLAEALAMGAVGGLYGILFGYIISHIFVLAVNLLSGYELEYIFHLLPYLISLGIAFGVSQLAAVGPARRASSVNIVEAILHE